MPHGGVSTQITGAILAIGAIPFLVPLRGLDVAGVTLCESPDQAFAWYMLIQSEGPGIIDTLQEIANNLDRQDAVPPDELERKEEDEGSDDNG